MTAEADFWKLHDEIYYKLREAYLGIDRTSYGPEVSFAAGLSATALFFLGVPGLGANRQAEKECIHALKHVARNAVESGITILCTKEVSE